MIAALAVSVFVMAWQYLWVVNTPGAPTMAIGEFVMPATWQFVLAEHAGLVLLTAIITTKRNMTFAGILALVGGIIGGFIFAGIQLAFS